MRLPGEGSSSQFSVLSSQFSVLSSQFSVLSSQFSVLRERLERKTLRTENFLHLHRYGKRSFRPCDRPVERVALDRFAPGFLDQAHQVVPPQTLGSGCSRIVVNLFLNHSAVNIVGSEAQGDLRNLRRHHLPVGLNVREVIEHQAADRNLLDVGHAGGRKKMLQRRVRGMEGQRDESLKATGLILQGTQFEQVVDAVFVVFDVAVKHGGVRFEPDLVGEARGIEPLIAVNLVIADNVPHTVGKNFAATARQRVDTRFFHFFERLADRQLRPLRQVRNLHHSEGLHVDLRKPLFQSGNEVEKILEGQIGMQPTDYVKLSDRFGVTGGGRLEGFFERHGVGARSVFLAAKGAAERAAERAADYYLGKKMHRRTTLMNVLSIYGSGQAECSQREWLAASRQGSHLG